MWRSTRKGHISETWHSNFVRYVDGGSDPSYPTPGELLKYHKAGDMEFKDWIKRKNIKLLGERLRICTWRTGDKVIIRIACVAGGMVKRGIRAAWENFKLTCSQTLRGSGAPPPNRQSLPTNPASYAGYCTDNHTRLQQLTYGKRENYIKFSGIRR